MCRACQRSVIEEDLERMQRLISCRNVTDACIDDLPASHIKSIIKKNNWAIWSFNRSLKHESTSYPSLNLASSALNTETPPSNDVEVLYNQSCEPNIEDFWNPNKAEDSNLFKGKLDSVNFTFNTEEKYESTNERSDVEDLSPLSIVLPLCRGKYTQIAGRECKKSKKMLQKQLSDDQTKHKLNTPLFRVTKMK
jgi:hypothetical protein